MPTALLLVSLRISPGVGASAIILMRMVCYFCECERLASFGCSCGRYACRDHVRGSVCCQCEEENRRREQENRRLAEAKLLRQQAGHAAERQSREEQERRREAERKKQEDLQRQQRWCDFCRRSLQATTTICRTCSRRFCDSHGQILELFSEPMPMRARYYFERCQEHLFRRGLLGHHEKPMNFIDIFFRDLAKVADKYTSGNYYGG
jgi:hypothetical protein